jgi:O-antigen/teichoic acid export membrane protein
MSSLNCLETRKESIQMETSTVETTAPEKSPSTTRSPMRSVLHATSVLAAGWLVTVVIRLLTSKVLAVVLGPSGFGYYGLLRNFVDLVTMVGGLGIGSAIVRYGANRIQNNDVVGIASIRQAAWLIFAASGTVATAILIIFRVTFSRWVLGSPDHPWSVALMAMAVLFSLASYIQVSTLNAYHRVKALAKSSVLECVLGGALAVTFVLIWREHAIAAVVIGAGAAAWLASRRFLKGEVGPASVRPPFRATAEAARSLLQIGVPYLGSSVFSVGAHLVVPMLVLQLLGAESVGHYRAAAAISVTYLGFLVTAMSQDYFPRVSAVSDKPATLRDLINNQQRLILLLGVPMLLGTMALVPYLIPIAYSSKFTPAVELLEWQLMGDIFRLSAWTLQIVILSRCSGKVFFLIESMLGTTTLLTSWAGARWFGLTGLGIAFLFSYAIYYLVVWLIVRREIDLVWSRTNKRLMAGSICAAFIVRLLPFTAFARFRTPVALTLAVAAGIGSLFLVLKELSANRDEVFDLKSLLAVLAKGGR